MKITETSNNTYVAQTHYTTMEKLIAMYKIVIYKMKTFVFIFYYFRKSNKFCHLFVDFLFEYIVQMHE